MPIPIHEVYPVTPIDIIEYGLYALVKTGRCSEEQILPAKAWLENDQACMDENDWRPDE